MPRPRRPYPAEFREEAVRLWRSVQKERSLREVAGELGVSMESLRGWVKRSDIDAGKARGLTTDEREELHRHRRESRVLREEREAAASLGRPTRPGEGLRVRRGTEGQPPRLHHVPPARCLPQRLLRLAVPPALAACHTRRHPDGIHQGGPRAKPRHVRGSRIHIELRLDHNIRCGRKRVARLMRAAGLEGCHRRRLRGLTRRDPGACGPRSRRAQLPGGGPGPAVDRRHHLRAHPQRVRLPRGRPRRLLPHGGGVVHPRGPHDPAGPRRRGHGDLSPEPGRRPRASLGSGLPVHLVGPRPPPARGRHPGFDGLGRRRLRQRHDGVVLRQPRCELLDRTQSRTKAEARLALFDYIERFYNRRRRHSSLGYLAPAEFERRAREADTDRITARA